LWRPSAWSLVARCRDPGLLRLEDDRAGAVAEQNAGRPVFPVEEAAERLRADHKGVIRHPALHHIVGDGERVEEAGADGGDVEGDTVVDAERGLDPSRAGGKGLIRESPSPAR
jgi:hypothetical protein